jgi:uncharacterized SAM-binding protein YcdF (DUF218 family)
MPDFAFSPLTYVLLLALALALSWRRLPRAIRIAGIVLEAVLLIAMAPLGANLLVWSVESRSPSPQSCGMPEPDTVVVLSGGTDRQPRSPGDFAALDASSLQRLLAGIALWERIPDARLVIAGGGRRIPESVLLAGLAERMGVPSGAIRIERHSHTTWENALYTARLSPPVPKRVWLVTSSLHMPRALGAFRAMGFQPCAWSSGSLHIPFSPHIGYFIPQESSLVKADRAIHELIGGIVYRALEWKQRGRQQPVAGANPGRRRQAARCGQSHEPDCRTGVSAMKSNDAAPGPARSAVGAAVRVVR